jgi:hypothetical protein
MIFILFHKYYNFLYNIGQSSSHLTSSKIRSIFSLDKGLVRLASFQPASSAFLSHHFSTNHQLLVSQQYFSLTTDQHWPPATSQSNEAKVCASMKKLEMRLRP